MSKNIVNQRFIEVINFLISEKKVPSKSFLAEKFGIKASKFSEILNERMNVGVDLLSILTDDYNINAEWLLTGNGSMLKEPAPPAVSPSQPQENDKYTISLEKQVAQLEKINALQEEKINELKERIEELQGKIKHLEYENSAFQEGLQGRATG